MAALDTNVLVRLLVEDDASQSAQANALLARCIREGQSLFVPITVALELEWVLRSAYGFTKPEVIQALSQLLSASELSFESESALELALHLYRQTTADFADCLHTALADRAGEPPLWTFDKSASKVQGAGQLGP